MLFRSPTSSSTTTPPHPTPPHPTPPHPTPPHPTPPHPIPPPGFEGVLTRQKGANKWCATFWDPCSANLVSLNSKIFNFRDSRHSWKVPSSPNGPWTSKLVLGFSSKARGCRSDGLRRKHILKNDSPQKDVSSDNRMEGGESESEWGG